MAASPADLEQPRFTPEVAPRPANFVAVRGHRRLFHFVTNLGNAPDMRVTSSSTVIGGLVRFAAMVSMDCIQRVNVSLKQVERELVDAQR